ncbi:MAG: hypothetical protein SGPRY_007251 [Prymnesium sp.]
MSVVLKAQEDCVGTNFNAMYNHPYNLHCYSRNDGTLSFLNQASTLYTLCTALALATSAAPYSVDATAAGRGPLGNRHGRRRAAALLRHSRVSSAPESFRPLLPRLVALQADALLAAALDQGTTSGQPRFGFRGGRTHHVITQHAITISPLDSQMCGMACGWLDMPFWTFFGATCLGKGLVKVSLQASVCITVFGKDCGEWMACKGVTARQGIMYKFALQERKDMTSFFSDESSLTKEALIEKYCSVLDDSDVLTATAKVLEKVDRVFAHLDQDGSGDLVASELKAAESLSDGKFSLDSLDPGSGSIFSIGNLWNAFILGLIIFFLISIVDQMAKSKQAQIDEAETQLEEEKLSKSK